MLSVPYVHLLRRLLRFVALDQQRCADRAHRRHRRCDEHDHPVARHERFLDRLLHGLAQGSSSSGGVTALRFIFSSSCCCLASSDSSKEAKRLFKLAPNVANKSTPKTAIAKSPAVWAKVLLIA